MSETMSNVATASVATACADSHVNTIFDNINSNVCLSVEDKYASSIKDAFEVKNISFINPFMRTSKEMYPPCCMVTYRQYIP